MSKDKGGKESEHTPLAGSSSAYHTHSLVFYHTTFLHERPLFVKTSINKLRSLCACLYFLMRLSHHIKHTGNIAICYSPVYLSLLV